MLDIYESLDKAINQFNETHYRFFNGLIEFESIGDCEKMQKVVNDFSKIAHLYELPRYLTIVHV
jgi:hypothetical protein